MKVSVLMAVWNGARHLAAAVESIRAQTMKDFEFIIVDDASTDETPELLSHWAREDNRLRVLRNASNLGLTKSLNVGLRAVRGELVARQDADDVSAPTRLEKQVNFFSQRPEIGLLGTFFREVNEAGELRALQQFAATDVSIRWQLLFQNAFAHSAVMMRRALLSQAELWYDEALPYSQDYDLWVRLMRHTQAANLTEPLIDFRVHEGRISARKQNEQYQLAAQISLRQWQELIPGGSWDLTTIEMLREWYHHLPGALRRNEEKALQAWLELWRAFARQPGLAPEATRAAQRFWFKRLATAVRRGNFSWDKKVWWRWQLFPGV